MGPRVGVVCALVLALAWGTWRDGSARVAQGNQARGPAGAGDPGSNVHAAGGKMGLVCCGWWSAPAFVDGKDVGAALDDTYEKVAREIAADEIRNRDVMCPYFRDDLSCKLAWERPHCAFGDKTSRGKTATSSLDAHEAVRTPKPRPRPIRPPAHLDPLRATLVGYRAIETAWPFPGCNPITSLRTAVDRYVGFVDECLGAAAREREAITTECVTGYWNPYCSAMLVPAPAAASTIDPVATLFAGKLSPRSMGTDPRSMWSIRGKFGGTHRQAGFASKRAASWQRCDQLFGAVPRLELPPLTFVELERPATVKHIGERRGAGRLIFGARGVLDDGAVLSPGKHPVVFAVPGASCQAQFGRAMVQYDLAPTGRRITVTGQVGDSVESIEMIEPYADSDGDSIVDKDDRCPKERGDARWYGCPDPDPDHDGFTGAQDKCPDRWGERWPGCPDTDGDGLTDDVDKCVIQRGPSSTNGCPDADDDGLADTEDRCPATPGDWTTDGCPKPTVAATPKPPPAPTPSQPTGPCEVLTITSGHVDGANDYKQTLMTCCCFRALDSLRSCVIRAHDTDSSNPEPQMQCCSANGGSFLARIQDPDPVCRR